MRVLVAVASRHDATREIGKAIASVLEAADHDVAFLAPEQVGSIQPYDAVVLGSAVYAGRWLGAARELAEREHEALRVRHVWLFSSGPIGDPPKPEAIPPEVQALRDAIGAVDHQVFEGKLDRGRLGVGEKLIVSAVRATPGDFRPWDAVLEWARWIAAALAPNPAEAPLVVEELPA